MKNIFTRVMLSAGLAALLCTAAFAQTSTPQSGTNAEGRRGLEGRLRQKGSRMGDGGPQGERGGGGGRPGRQGMERRALRQLNLSETQRGQLREIEARYGQGFKAQRQELRQLIELRQQGATLTPEQQQRAQQLRGEVRDHGEKMRAEILALLTPEQRDQLKRMREEGRARRKERREAFGKPDDNQ